MYSLTLSNFNNIRPYKDKNDYYIGFWKDVISSHQVSVIEGELLA